jgi:hypothetical protein
VDSSIGRGGWSGADGDGIFIGGSMGGFSGAGSGEPFLTAGYSAADVQAALAQCDLPHGPVASTPTYRDKRSLMVGAWIHCPPTTQTVFRSAIAFAPDGSWQRLLSDGNGGLVPGYGGGNQGNYAFPRPDADPTNGYAQVTVRALSGSFLPSDYSGGGISLETAPRRMYTVQSYLDQSFEGWLVRLPGEIQVPTSGEGGRGGGPVAGTGGSRTGGSMGGFSGAGSGEPFLTAGYSAADVQAALAQCDLPHGPVASTPTFGDKRSFMIGAWIECPPPTQTVFRSAIAFAPDGSWQRLLSDGNGGLAPGYGVRNQGNYGFSHPDGDPTNGITYVTIKDATGSDLPGGSTSGAISLETSPRRMRAVFSYLNDNFDVWLVRLP